MESISESITETDQQAHKMLFILGRQGIEVMQENYEILDRIIKLENEQYPEYAYISTIHYSFMYGYIQGKRAERKRKKVCDCKFAQNRIPSGR